MLTSAQEIMAKRTQGGVATATPMSCWIEHRQSTEDVGKEVRVFEVI